MKIITCPNCKRFQTMEYNKQDNVWFPIRPFCCIVMEYSDTPEWNKQLDYALSCATMYPFINLNTFSEVKL